MVKVLNGIIIAVLLVEILHQTGRVAGIRGCHAVANLSPHVGASLTTAASEEEVVVHLVVGGGL